MLTLKILIADEEPVSRNMLKTALLYWGCEVFAVEDGKQACAVLQAESIDLCILSWNTRKLTGLEVCRWIRQAELKRTPYTILLADDQQPEEIREAYLAGANDFLTKPLRMEDVRARISKVGARIAQVRSMHTQLRCMDPLECYRLDLALYQKAYSRA
jgi:DNA-binding response OmpR family regulator